MVTRFLALLAVLVLGFAQGTAAHEGHLPSRLVVENTAEKIGEDRLIVHLRLSNYQETDVALNAVAAPGARIVSSGAPVVVPAGTQARVSVIAEFTPVVPGILTLMLDFGPDGAAPITIFP